MEAAVRVKQIEELSELVARLYEECGQELIPTYPKILVRVLPKEQRRGSIILPGDKQNKPTWEGIVLRTYEPFWRPIDRLVDGIPMKFLRERVEPVVKQGDHVLFPHIAEGQFPCWPIDAGRGDYRLIPEWQLHTRLEYKSKPLKRELADRLGLSIGQIEDFLEHYDVLRKDISSKTLSGR